MTPERAPTGSTSDTLSVLIVDDHTLLSETLADALNAQPGFAVRTVGTVEAALAEIAEHGPRDVVLLDYELPGTQGLEGLRQMMAANGGRVALFSGVMGWPMADRALQMGAAGFLPKTQSLKVIAHAIRLIAEGEVYVPSAVLREITRDDGSFGLKPRELRVLACLNEGMTNKEIGRAVDLDEVIVKSVMRAICRKLGVTNRTEALVMARKQRLL
ncbi:response regulator transcription factor [Rhodobaculum claviforme]|nr:response regulator transcription factor [Rhodobaculum claviforme]